MFRRKPNNKKFSLLELIIVMAIMLALIGVGAPKLLKYGKEGQKVSMLTEAKLVNDAVIRYYLDTEGDFPRDISKPLDFTTISGGYYNLQGEYVLLDNIDKSEKWYDIAIQELDIDLSHSSYNYILRNPVSYVVVADWKTLTTERQELIKTNPLIEVNNNEMQNNNSIMNFNNTFAAGDNTILALKKDGSIFKWGRSIVGSHPSGNNFVNVSMGAEHGVVLKDDGSILSLGNNIYEQVYQTPKEKDFIMVAAGGNHSYAIKKDNTLISWGINENGLLYTPSGKIKEISTGTWYSCVIKEDGSLEAWGTIDSNNISNVPIGNDFTQISVGADHIIALKSDGSIKSWGNNGSGQVSKTPIEKDFKAVAAGSSHSIALKKDGSLKSWGYDLNNQVNHTPKGNDFIAIDAGNHYSMAMKFDGTIIVWGDNSYNQVNNTPSSNDFMLPN